MLIAEASRAAAKANDRPLHDHLANLLRDVLLYDLTPHSDLADPLDAEIALLALHPARHPQMSATLSSAAKHAAAVITVKPNVEMVIEKLNSVPTAHSVDAISSTYAHDYEQVQKANEMYRLLVYLCS